MKCFNKSCKKEIKIIAVCIDCYEKIMCELTLAQYQNEQCLVEMKLLKDKIYELEFYADLEAGLATDEEIIEFHKWEEKRDETIHKKDNHK